MKIIAVILLAVGIGLGGLGTYGYFFSEDRARCQTLRSEALALSEQALAAEGTPKGAALSQEARETSGVADVACKNASQTQQTVLMTGLGGIAAIIVSVVLLIISRKRRPNLEQVQTA